MLALTFANKADYDLIQENDHLDVLGLNDFRPGQPLRMRLHHENGSEHFLELNHSYNEAQIAWFRAGGALNIIRAQASVS